MLILEACLNLNPFISTRGNLHFKYMASYFICLTSSLQIVQVGVDLYYAILSLYIYLK